MSVSRIFRDVAYKPQTLVLVAVALCLSLAFFEWVPHPWAASLDGRSERPFTVVVLPDTQVYSESLPKAFEAQTEWIAANKDVRNIVFVSHVGDIVNKPEDEEQWQRASRAMSRLDGVVPYSILPGNHDMVPGGSAKYFAKYFPLQRQQKSPTWGGTFTDNTERYSAGSSFAHKNNYQLFSAGGQDYIAISLEFCPPAQVLAWASGLLETYKDRRAIITTHSFLNSTAARQDYTACVMYNSEGQMAGAEIWHELIEVKKHRNIDFFLGGHDIWTKAGAARRTDYADGKPVHQLLSNYQHLPNGGDGYLRIMTFSPGGKKVKVETFSPYQGASKTDPDNRFELSL